MIARRRSIRHARKKKVEKTLSDSPIYWFMLIGFVAYGIGTWLWSLVPLHEWQR